MWDSEELHQRRFVVVLSLGMFCLLSISVQAKYSGGSGTAEEDPYQIATAADLMLLGESPEDYDKHFILTADIDLDPNLPGRKVFDGTVIAPETYDTGDWRFEGSPFTGVFDGNGHTIRNLVIEGDNYIGLFGSLGSGSCIRSLAIKNAEITAAGSYVGILAGQNEYGSISHCCSTGFVSGRSSVGGLVGKNGTGRSTQSSIISHCYSTSSVKAASWVGGLVGHNVREIVSSFSVGRLLPSVGRVWPGSGSQFVGGLVGNGSSFKAVGSFWDVEASGQITSSGGMGLRTSEMMDPYWYALNGWAGDPNWVLDSGRDYPRFAWEATAGEPIPSANIDWLDGSGTALDPYRLVNADQLFQIGRASILWNAHFVLCAELDLGHVTCSTAVIPRFEGVFDGRHWDMRNLTIRGRNTLGLFGVLGDGAIVRNVSIVDAKVTNERDCTGILAGYNRGDVMNCHSSGMVTSDGNWTGGLVGTNVGRISSCFSTGNVQGATYPVGGLVGSNYGRINRCFSTGNVQGGTYYVGGLVGQNHGRITECYSTGYVSGKSKVGGLVGIQEGGSVAHSFWDIETSRRATSAGGIGKTTAEMQDPNTFMAAGWDFAGKPDAPTYIWVEPVGTGYPILWWQSSILPELPAFSGGTGEPAAPYLITTADELSSIGYNPRLMEAHFKLMLDVDLWGLPFYPIGNEVHPYVGVFDGNSHTISNLSYDSNGVDCVGLFGYVSREGAQVRDLGLIEAKIQIGTGANIGALVGRLMDGTISGCYSQDSDVLGSGSYVGGLVGENDRGTITDCFATGTVVGNSHIGGLVGSNTGTLANCHSSCEVSGLAGEATSVGGLLGSNHGDVIQCHSSGAISGDVNIGGLMGGNHGKVIDCNSIGMVNGHWNVGGLLGENDGDVTGCWSTGAAIGFEHVGGLVGYNNDTIKDCYATGAVTGDKFVGGLAGSNYGAAIYCYSAGVIIGSEDVGGLVGSDSGHVTSCYWDMETSEQTDSDGGVAKTTSEMQMSSTFFGWGGCGNENRSMWTIDEGNDYPRLWWENVSGHVIEPTWQCFVFATNPEPPDHSYHEDTRANLTWVPGHLATSHNVYFGDNFDDVNDGTWDTFRGNQNSTFLAVGSPGFAYRDGLVPGTTYYWRVDEVNDMYPESPLKGAVWSFTIPHLTAYDPYPPDGYVCDDTWASLSWSPGDFAVSHDVYFGENFDDVNDGADGTFLGNQTSTFFAAGFSGFPYPDGLVPGTTYYWRIDEVNDAEPHSPWKGHVWRFSVPPKTAYNPDPADGADFVDPRATLNWTAGFGSKLHTVYMGTNFDEVNDAVGGAPQGTTTYSPGTLETGKVYYWRVDEFDAVETHKGDIWSFTTPGAVGNPQPANAAADVQMTATLSWTPADNTVSHELYFGTDEDAVKNATVASPAYIGPKALGAESYDPGKLAWNTAYHWRVDEVYSTETVKGLVWSFTTADFLVVDDFESYNDIDPPDPGSHRIFDVWIDGFGTTHNGALVDWGWWDWEMPVHSGSQSMPFLYDNNLKTSEATANITDLAIDQDWTTEGVGILSLWFYGNPANAPEPMYVALASYDGPAAVVYHDNADAAQIEEWTEWTIDLQEFAAQGVDLTSISTISIGFGDENDLQAGGSGVMYFDDIRLYRRLTQRPGW